MSETLAQETAPNSYLKREERREILAGGIDPQAKMDPSEPIYVSSDTLSLDAKKRIFTYKGNVEAFQADLFITAEEMIGTYDENNRLKEVVCHSDVVVTRGDRLRAIANKAVYDVANQNIVLSEGPEVIERSNALSADRITLYIDEDRSEAEGRVRVKLIREQEGNEGVRSLFDAKKINKKSIKETP